VPVVAVILAFAASLFADCRVLSLDDRATAVTITCSHFPAGLSKTFREYEGNEWARYVGLDTASADTLTTKRKK
jgi:hypothetical protein